MLFDTARISSLTDCTDVQPYRKGLSLNKFTAKYDGVDVIIRIYPEVEYYMNRFERERFALNELRKFSEVSPLSFAFPKIVKEVEEYNIRVLDWMEGKPINVKANSSKILSMTNTLSKWKTDEKQFNLHDDIHDHLKNIENMTPKDQEEYEAAVAPIFDNLPILETDDPVLIHGDFYHENILYDNQSQKISLIDWEFASTGLKYFDLAYLSVYSDWLPPKYMVEKITTLKPFVFAFLCHWFLSFRNSSREECHYWINRLTNEIDSQYD
ncbi:MAG: phosphotransferase [Candidatus Kariarchaeaceae archaeon]|jgi:thiamine kinase-like enzyme